MGFRHVPEANPLIATNCGAGLAAEAECRHGHAAFGVHLVGTHASPPAPGTTDDGVHVLMPRCLATHLVGTLTATIAHTEGMAAAKAFMDDCRTAFSEALTGLRDLTAQGRDCCEAAFLTGGREHTCKNDQDEAGRG